MQEYNSIISIAFQKSSFPITGFAHFAPHASNNGIEDFYIDKIPNHFRHDLQVFAQRRCFKVLIIREEFSGL